MSNLFSKNALRRQLLIVAGLGVISAIALGIFDKPVTAKSNSHSPTNSRVTIVSFNLNNYKWKNRLLLVFAPSEQNSAYQKQKQLFKGHQSQLDERDLRVVEVLANGKSHVDNQAINTAEVSQLRHRFNIGKDEFCIILVGKDGYEKRRVYAPIELTRIFNQVDQMPMRQQEMRQK